MVNCFWGKFLRVCILFLIQNQILHSQSIIRVPYLQSVTSHSVIICWRTDSLTTSRVSFGPLLSSADQVVDSFTLKTEHRVTITNLLPSTKYYYAVGSDSHQLAGLDSNHYFITAPPVGDQKKIRIWATGDYGRGNTPQRRVMNSFLDFTKSSPADIWITMGDNAYNDGTDAQFQSNVFDTLKGFGKLFPHLPYWPSPGNHDYHSVNANDPPETHTGPYFDIIEVPQNGEAGGVPSGTEVFYSFDYGNVHFISLNSEAKDWLLTVPSRMSEWLRADLKANQQKWVIVYCHQPPYSRGSHNSDLAFETHMIAMRTNFTPIFDEFGVDLVVAGHSHTYERSYMIHGHTGPSSSFDSDLHIVNPASGIFADNEEYIKDTLGPLKNRGTMYVVAGNAGSGGNQQGLNHPVMYYSYGCDTCYGSLIIDVEGERLDGTYFTVNNDVLDHFTIVKTGFTYLEDDELIRVFPNPSKGIVNVYAEPEIQSVYSYSVLDAFGKTVLESKNALTKNFSFPMTDMADGIYVLQLVTSSGRFAKKIVLRK